MKVWSHPQSDCMGTGEGSDKYRVVFSFMLWLGSYFYKVLAK
jgi:hypothetical protein